MISDAIKIESSKSSILIIVLNIFITISKELLLSLGLNSQKTKL